MTNLLPFLRDQGTVGTENTKKKNLAYLLASCRLSWGFVSRLIADAIRYSPDFMPIEHPLSARLFHA